MDVVAELSQRAQQADALLKSGGTAVYPASRGFLSILNKDTSSLGYIDPQSGVIGTDERLASATFCMATETPDMEGDIIVPSGIQLANYAKNPVWFFAHQGQDHAPEWLIPIGVAEHPQTKELHCWVENNRFYADIFFDQHDTDAMFIADKVFRGFLRAGSVGIQPVEAERLRTKAHQGGTFPVPRILVKRCDLFENSICGVGVNREALRMSLDGGGCSERLRRVLEPMAAETKAWSPGVGEGDMSKKWGKTVPKKTEPEEKAAETPPPVEKALGTISDTSGGTLVAPEVKSERASGESLQDCVSRKIAIIQKDHPDWKDDQVQAAAFSMCGEQKTEKSATTYPDAEPMESTEDAEGDDMPFGAKCLKGLLEHAEGSIDNIEQPKVKAFYLALIEGARSIAKEEYPDEAFGEGKAPKIEGLNDMVSVQVKALLTKSAKHRYKGILKDLHDHLGDSAEHHEALGDMLKEIGDGEEERSDERAEQKPKEKSVTVETVKAIAASADDEMWQKVLSRLNNVQTVIARETGAPL